MCIWACPGHNVTSWGSVIFWWCHYHLKPPTWYVETVLFVWLISHDRKYRWLICCEKKILLWQIWLISLSATLTKRPLSRLPCLCVKLIWNLLLRLYVSHVYHILRNTCVLIRKSSVCNTAGRIFGSRLIWNLFRSFHRLGQLRDRRPTCLPVGAEFFFTVQPVIGPVTRPTAHWWLGCHGLKSFATADCRT